MPKLKEVVITAKMTPLARMKIAQRLIRAFNEARARGDRYFWSDDADGWITTRRRGESVEHWIDNTIDNTTGGGSNRVLTSVGGSFNGKKGREGTWTRNGWITFNNTSNSGPVEARGNYHSNNRGYIKADLPKDKLVSKRGGTDRGRQSTNTRTGITVGNPNYNKDADLRRTNRSEPTLSYYNWDLGDFVDAVMPATAIANGINGLYKHIVDKPYKPFIVPSGFNPFGLTKDAVQNNYYNIASRGIDAYTSLGMPGVTNAIDYLGTRFAPKMATLSSKSAYIPDAVTNGADLLPQWHLYSLAGKRASTEFGKRSMQRASNSGAFIPTGATRAMLNTNTGTTYFWKANTPQSYDNVVEVTKNVTPWAGFIDGSINNALYGN